MKRYIPLIVFVLTLYGCDIDLFGRDVHKITPCYYLLTGEGQKTLSYNDSTMGSSYVTLIGNEVSAIGQNKNYILIKQHPQGSTDTANPPITSYYILPIDTAIDLKTNYPLIGPLTLNEFEAKRKELHIQDIKFKMVDDF